MSPPTDASVKANGMHFQLRTEDLEESKRFEFWHDAVCQPLLHITPDLIADTSSFKASLDVRVVGQFAFAEMNGSHGHMERTGSDLARADCDGVLAYLATSARQHHRLGPDEFEVEAGDVCIVPLDQCYRGTATDVGFRTLIIPKSVLGPLIAGRELTQARHLPKGTPLAALLSASLDAAFVQLPRLDDHVAEAALGSIVGLVALACGTSDEGEPAGRDATRTARLLIVKRHVRQPLSDPLLDPRGVAAAFGMSVRQIHLLFQASNDRFTRHVLHQRLEACRATLSGPMGVGRSVADVAFGWGFNSLSVFYRAFAETFDASPGDVRPPVRGQA